MKRVTGDGYWGGSSGDDEPEQEVMHVGAKTTEFFRLHDRNVGVQAVPRTHARGSQATMATKDKAVRQWVDVSIPRFWRRRF